MCTLGFIQYAYIKEFCKKKKNISKIFQDLYISEFEETFFCASYFLMKMRETVPD